MNVSSAGKIKPVTVVRKILQWSVCLLCASPTFAQTTNTLGLSNKQVFNSMAALVTTHDVSIPVGLLPFPSVQLAAEAVELSSNLALKSLPPWLEAPAGVTVTPNSGACSYSFDLPSPRGGYENMFGFFNIEELVDDGAGNKLRWDDTGRWGAFGAPEVYHANTSVEIEVSAGNQPVRIFDPVTGMFNDPNSPIYPIDPASDLQEVIFPIGFHQLRWTASTKLNPIADIIAPTAMLAIGILTELKNARGGAQAAKKLKSADLGDSVIGEAPSAQEVGRVFEGAQRFDEVWQGQWKSRRRLQEAETNGGLRAKFVKNIKCKMQSLIIKVLDLGVRRGLSHVDVDTGSTLLRHGDITLLESDLITITWRELIKAQRDTRISAVKAMLGLACKGSNDVGSDDAAKFVTDVSLTFAGSFDLGKLISVTTAQSFAPQSLQVLDTEPPIINIDPEPIILEASSPDGVSSYRVRDELEEKVRPGVTDNCGRVPHLFSDMPDIIPLQGSDDPATEITWTAIDLGPNPPGRELEFRPTAPQFVRVLDTQPPILLAPAGKARLADPHSQALSLDEADIGRAAATDLADFEPNVSHDAPATFSVNTRTTVTWTALDKSGNSTSTTQLVTVKDSNTTPTATADINAFTLTARPVDIRLTGVDSDMLQGRVDPLWFAIEQYPKHGEFEAPLLPFFIEDYRTKPGDGLPSDDVRGDQVPGFITDSYCNAEGAYFGEDVPRSFVHEPHFVQVTDERVRFVLDTFFICSESIAEPRLRISKWDAEGEFLGQMRFDTIDDAPGNSAFVLDRDGFIHYFNAIGGGSSSAEFDLHSCKSNFEEFSGREVSSAEACPGNFQFDSDSVPDSYSNWSIGRVSYARADSNNELIYIGTDRSIFAFELTSDGVGDFLAELGPKDEGTGEVLSNWLGNGAAIEVDSAGNIYLADAQQHKVHKIAAPTSDPNQPYIPGDYVGWAGKCTGSTNKACNIAEGQNRSRGYSCTDTTCLRDGTGAGDQPGQFNLPSYLALDPRDILYIADTNNDRIQRLSPDGQFAGEAVSTGTGINRGEQPGFILGNFESPASVSVNSSQFYIVDWREKFVHVFGTLPFKDVTDEGATVTYRSTEKMPNTEDGAQDQFVFSVSDDIDSDQATVTIDIDRQYRTPEALPADVELAEDTLGYAITLKGDDPDGIIGRDYFGRDTLSFMVISQPMHGTLSGNGENRLYTPDENFFGPDSFRFKVNDGLEDSTEAVVSITVIPVNDPPSITLEPLPRVARGIPMLLTAKFLDDDKPGALPLLPEQRGAPEAEDEVPPHYNGFVSWGDGSHSEPGDFDSSDPDEPVIRGVAVAEPPDIEMEGWTFAEHTYTEAGVRELQVCVTDAGGLPACDLVQFEVENLVSLGFGGEVVTAESVLTDDIVTEVGDSEAFSYKLMFVNEQPEGYDGLIAHGATFEAELAYGLSYGALSTSRGHCSRSGLQISCDFGDLEPGAEITVGLAARGPGGLIYNEDKALHGVFSTISDAVEPEIEAQFNIILTTDTSDGDGDGMPDTFEIRYGLNLTRDDASNDADGDGLSNLEEYEIGTSPQSRDSDLDGLSDFKEHWDVGTDPVSADSDGDAMPDGWEYRFGLDPMDDRDAEFDSDGDGVSNYDEYLSGGDPTVDDVPPLISAPQDIYGNSTGALTSVPLGTASAWDAKDGSLTARAVNPGPFPAGVNSVSWKATDKAGNSAEDVQRVSITPRVNLQADQLAAEGASVIVRFELNGEAVWYPVNVPYTVSGSAEFAEDHNAAAGVVIIEEGSVGNISINLLEDGIFEPDEELVISLGEPVNAIAGTNTSHTITVSDYNFPPRVDLAVEQLGELTATIITGSGPVGISSRVSDSPRDSHSYDWSGSDSALVSPGAVTETGYALDPSGLSEGIYGLELLVTDDGKPPAATTTHTLLRVLAESPLLSESEDTDGDGIDDASEGIGDADADRIANYLDADDIAHWLPLGGEKRSLQTTPGYQLRLGRVSFTLGTAGAEREEVELGVDVEFGYPNGVYDYEVTGLAPGEKTELVVPLVHALVEGAVYRNYLNGNWTAFIADEENIIASAPGESGACPEPGSDQYRAGLSSGHYCLQITRNDGGPNDADGFADGVITVMGGVAVAVNVAIRDSKIDPGDSSDDRRVLKHYVFESTSGDASLDYWSFTIGNGELITQNYRVLLELESVSGEGLGTVLAETELGPNDTEFSFRLAQPFIMAAGEFHFKVILMESKN